MNEQLSLIQRFRKTVIGEYAEALIWAVALALVLTTFVVQAFKIPSGSMLETLQIGDHLLVNKFLYGLRNPFNDDYLIRGVEPKVGDIIVFRYPKDRSLDYIKRIVGVPGDTLEMRNKVLYRNGVEVQEPYTHHDSGPRQLGADHRARRQVFRARRQPRRFRRFPLLGFP